MRIFVTGGSGFLGKRLIQRLIREAHHVTAVARSDASYQTLNRLGAQAVQGSMENIHPWENHLSGHDAVIHCAAPVEFWGFVG